MFGRLFALILAATAMLPTPARADPPRATAPTTAQPTAQATARATIVRPVTVRTDGRAPRVESGSDRTVPIIARTATRPCGTATPQPCALTVFDIP